MIKKIINRISWKTINAILFLALIIYFILKLFVSYAWLKNLPVIAILILCAYNAWYFFNTICLQFRIGAIGKEAVGFISILIGTWAGTFILDYLNISIFTIDDVKDTLLVAIIFNTVRSAINIYHLRTNALSKQKEADDLKLKQANTKAQLELLYYKINPHFLYNSLNSIAALAMVDGKKTKDMTLALSKLLRYSLDSNEDNMSTIEDEIQVVHTYFDIEKIRFGENLNYKIEMADETKNYIVPKFLLQPLIENAVIHALNEAEENSFIQVNVNVINKQLVISIYDNGKAFPEKMIFGYGLKNVTERLDLLFPGKNEFQIFNKPEKHIEIIIKEPQHKNDF